jgi:isopentenyl phosphate kinase
MMLIKLGGSAITDKSKPLTSRAEDIKRLAREIACVEGSKIIVHGGGSFGHIKAAEFKLNEGFVDDSQREGICLVQKDMRKLNAIVMDAFREAGVPVASVPAGAITLFDDGQMVKFPSEVFAHYVKLGIMPITFGDVVVDKTRGIAICSGDDIMLQLSKDTDAVKCVFVTSVDGIFESYPPEEGEYPLNVVGPDTEIRFRSEDVDVTGSMKRKLDLMIEMTGSGKEVTVVNGLVPDRLTDALMGNEFIGTRVKGD